MTKAVEMLVLNKMNNQADKENENLRRRLGLGNDESVYELLIDDRYIITSARKIYSILWGLFNSELALSEEPDEKSISILSDFLGDNKESKRLANSEKWKKWMTEGIAYEERINVFRIALAFSVEYDEFLKLLTSVDGDCVNFRDYEEIIYDYCIKRKYTLKRADALLKRYKNDKVESAKQYLRKTKSFTKTNTLTSDKEDKAFINDVISVLDGICVVYGNIKKVIEEYGKKNGYKKEKIDKIKKVVQEYSNTVAKVDNDILGGDTFCVDYELFNDKTDDEADDEFIKIMNSSYTGLCGYSVTQIAKFARITQYLWKKYPYICETREEEMDIFPVLNYEKRIHDNGKCLIQYQKTIDKTEELSQVKSPDEYDGLFPNAGQLYQSMTDGCQQYTGPLKKDELFKLSYIYYDFGQRLNNKYAVLYNGRRTTNMNYTKVRRDEVLLLLFFFIISNNTKIIDKEMLPKISEELFDHPNLLFAQEVWENFDKIMYDLQKRIKNEVEPKRRRMKEKMEYGKNAEKEMRELYFLIQDLLNNVLLDMGFYKVYLPNLFDRYIIACLISSCPNNEWLVGNIPPTSDSDAEL